jgi:hypothetical protein
MVGLEQTVVPLIGRNDFGIESNTLIVSFIASFGAVKAVLNLFVHKRSRVILEVRDSPRYAERFALVESPNQFYTLRAYIDLYEFIFRLHRTDAIDDQQWIRGLLGLRQ